MRKILVKMLNEDGTVHHQDIYSPEDLGITGDAWDGDDVDCTLDILKECMPSAFTISGNYDFEIIEE